MKSLYESILSSTKSGKKAFLRSFSINDILSANIKLDWDKFILVGEMKKAVKNKLKISTKYLIRSQIFEQYLTTIEFTLDEWDIIQNPSSSNLDEVDKIFKEKFKDILIPEFVKYYTFVKTKTQLYVRIKGQRIPDDLGVLIGDPHLVRFK